MGQQQTQSSDTGADSSGLPPFFSSWARLYASVLSFLAFLIFLFYLLTKAYS